MTYDSRLAAVYSRPRDLPFPPVVGCLLESMRGVSSGAPPSVFGNPIRSAFGPVGFAFGGTWQMVPLGIVTPGPMPRR
jgi:hypothetical protein